MHGDDRSRFCTQCNLHVYSFSQMSAKEIEQLLAEKEGRICARIYQRSDGTIPTQDCPIGLRSRIQRAGRIVVSALSAAMSVCVAVAQTTIPKQSSVEAEVATARLSITVTDPTGAAIPDCDVTLKSLDGKVVLVGKTDRTGHRKIDEIVPGTYKLELAAPGFANEENEIKITSSPTSINRSLKIGSTVLM